MNRMLFFLAFALFGGRGFSQNADLLAKAQDSIFWANKVDSLRNQAIQFIKKSQFQDALAFAKQAVRMTEEKFGPQNTQTATSAFVLGDCYERLSFLDSSETALEKSLQIRERLLGKENIETLSTLIALARVNRQNSQLPKAESRLLEAKLLLEKTNQTKENDYRICLGNLAEVYLDKGDFDQSEAFYQEVKKIKERKYGKESASYGATVHDLGNVYWLSGRFEEASNAYKTALGIFLKKLGTDHPYPANAYGNLARVLDVSGYYGEAEKMYKEAASIRKKIYGESGYFYAYSITELATFYQHVGRVSKVISLLEQAREIFISTQNTGTPYYGITASNLGAAYFSTGLLNKAEFYFNESKEAIGKALGKESAYYAVSLCQLAELYRVTNRYAEAEKLIDEELQVWDIKQNNTSLQYGDAMRQAADFFLDKPNLEKAATILADARNRTETACGKDNLTYIDLIERTAKLAARTGNYDDAQSLIIEASERERNIIKRESNAFSEKDIKGFLETVDNSSEILFSLLFQVPRGQRTLSGSAFDNLLFYKGYLLQGIQQMQQVVAQADDSTRLLYDRWKGYHRQLSQQYALPFAERQNTVSIEEKASALEGDLAGRVVGFGQVRRQVSWQEVLVQLKPGEAAIEFAKFNFRNSDKLDSTLYAALVLRPGWTAPKFIPLFEEKQLDSLLQRNNERKEAYVKQLYSLADRGVTIVGQPKKSLAQLIWQPLEKDLSGVTTVYFSPSGLLHRLNFSAIPISADSTLADRYNLVELSSTRQLVVPQKVEAKNNEAQLFGGIQYDMDSTAIFGANAKLDSTAIASRGVPIAIGMSFSQTDSTLRGGIWNYLPGTEKEVAALEKILQTTGLKTETRRGYAATEEAFKHIGNPQNGDFAKSPHSPRILHLATHGFFFPDPKDTTHRQTLGDREPVFKISDNPLIRSGLILAGGNQAWQTGKPLKPGMDDGILTAYEISQLDLSNTELVVLSACETGLGDIQGNEGVYGLQRAFKIAGAKYLIMSLWQVPDRQTSLLMTTFYKKWLTDKLPIPEAFRAAQKELRETGLDPYQWAGFVLVE